MERVFDGYRETGERVTVDAGQDGRAAIQVDGQPWRLVAGDRVTLQHAVGTPRRLEVTGRHGQTFLAARSHH